MVVLDTNVIIDFLEGKERIVAAIKKYPSIELATTFVNQYELLKYAGRKGFEEALENLFVYNSSQPSSAAAANAYRQLKAHGKTLSDNDLMVFGVCVANNEILVTQDRGFEALASDRIIVIK